MYGLILENIADFIRRHHGPHVWQEIQYVANLDVAAFETHEVYSEALPQRIVWAMHEVTGIPVDELMERIGSSFYEFITTYDYDKILRVLGRNFTDFLNGLDNLHEYIRFSYPKLKPPSFYCENESKTGLTLHYRSKRVGFLHYVKGQIIAIAKTLYDCVVKIEVVDKEIDENLNQHIILRLHFNNVDYKKSVVEVVDEDMIHSIVQITSDVMFDIFPFIIVFNRGMRIRNIGLGLMRILPALIGKKINEKFVLMRPAVSFRWEQVMLYSNNIFELLSIDPVYNDGKINAITTTDLKEIQDERRRMTSEDKQRYLALKGQMMYMEEWESICFLGIPLMADLEQLFNTGLFINDFALHDSSRDLVLASTQQKAEIRLLLDQEAKKKGKLEENMKEVEKARERTNLLLYQMLPKSVADKIRTGFNTLDTCETFTNSTILFTDVVGFTTLCSGITPLDVVRFLNMMYSIFDALSEKHQVFKVETIGDAYMVVGGVPIRNRHHAEQVCDAAMAIVNAVKTMKEASTNKRVRIRAGVHSGPVITGVVGAKMPRYCLFGENVLIANNMESTGQPMKIQISEATKTILEQGHSGLFKFTQYAYYEIRDGKNMRTYWLDSKNGPARADQEETTRSGSPTDSVIEE